MMMTGDNFSQPEEGIYGTAIRVDNFFQISVYDLLSDKLNIFAWTCPIPSLIGRYPEIVSINRSVVTLRFRNDNYDDTTRSVLIGVNISESKLSFIICQILHIFHTYSRLTFFNFHLRIQQGGMQIANKYNISSLLYLV